MDVMGLNHIKYCALTWLMMWRQSVDTMRRFSLCGPRIVCCREEVRWHCYGYAVERSIRLYACVISNAPS